MPDPSGGFSLWAFVVRAPTRFFTQACSESVDRVDGRDNGCCCCSSGGSGAEPSGSSGGDGEAGSGDRAGPAAKGGAKVLRMPPPIDVAVEGRGPLEPPANMDALVALVDGRFVMAVNGRALILVDTEEDVEAFLHGLDGPASGGGQCGVSSNSGPPNASIGGCDGSRGTC